MREGPHFLAFETGGTKLVAAIAGPDSRLVATTVVRRRPQDRAPTSLRRIAEAAESLLSEYGLAKGDIRSIGFGFGGTVRRSANRPHLCLHEDGWDDFDVAPLLAKRFGTAVHVENDCKLAALAEAHFGAGAEARSVFYVTLGTGVGGGFVRDGEINELGDLGEAEIGHVVVDPDGPDCSCGNRGCVEALCSGPGLSHLCDHFAKRDPAAWRSSVLSADADGNSAAPSERIVQAWEADDAFAGHVIDHALGGLASALATTVNLLVPERIVIGGGLGGASANLIPCLRRHVQPLVVPYFRDRYQILPSTLRENVVTQGAAILATQRSAGGFAG